MPRVLMPHVLTPHVLTPRSRSANEIHEACDPGGRVWGDELDGRVMRRLPGKLHRTTDCQPLPDLQKVIVVVLAIVDG